MRLPSAFELLHAHFVYFGYTKLENRAFEVHEIEPQLKELA